MCIRSRLLLNIIRWFPIEFKTKTKHNSLAGSVSPCTICPLLPSQSSNYTVLSLTVFQLHKQPSPLFICSTNVPSFLPPCASHWFAMYKLENQDSWWYNLVQKSENQECWCSRARENGCPVQVKNKFCPLSIFLSNSGIHQIEWHLLALVRVVSPTQSDSDANLLYRDPHRHI